MLIFNHRRMIIDQDKFCQLYDYDVMNVNIDMDSVIIQ